MKCILLLAFASAGLALGSQGAAGSTDTVDPVLSAEIRHLMDKIHVTDLMRQQMQTMMPPLIGMMKQNSSVSPEFVDEFAKRFPAEIGTADLEDLVVKAYAAHFTLAEIKDLEGFYDSPTGKKLIDAQPRLMAEVAQGAGKYGQTLAMRVGSEIAREHPEYLKRGTADPAQGGVIGGVIGGAPPPPPNPVVPLISKYPSAQSVDASAQEARLVNKVEPVYPPVAKSARVQGTVEFTAVINTEGKVQELQLVRGHPLLINAAKEAVLQWTYEPVLVNGKPVIVVTRILVNFTLSQN